MGIERETRANADAYFMAILNFADLAYKYKSLPLKGREISPGNSVTGVLNVEKLRGNL